MDASALLWTVPGGVAAPTKGSLYGNRQFLVNPAPYAGHAGHGAGPHSPREELEVKAILEAERKAILDGEGVDLEDVEYFEGFGGVV